MVLTKFNVCMCIEFIIQVPKQKNAHVSFLLGWYFEFNITGTLQHIVLEGTNYCNVNDWCCSSLEAWKPRIFHNYNFSLSALWEFIAVMYHY